jgi:hypothetical protein
MESEAEMPSAARTTAVSTEATEPAAPLQVRTFLIADDEMPPNHSVLSKARRCFGGTVYRAFFTEVVLQCGVVIRAVPRPSLLAVIGMSWYL